MLRPERLAGPGEGGTWPGHSEASPQLCGLPASPGTRHWAGGLQPSSPLKPSSNPGRPVLLIPHVTEGETEVQTHGQPVQGPEGCAWRSRESQPGQSVCKARGPLRVHTPGPAFSLVNTTSAYGGPSNRHALSLALPLALQRDKTSIHKNVEDVKIRLCGPCAECGRIQRRRKLRWTGVVQEGFLEEGVGLQMVSECSLWKPQGHVAKTAWGYATWGLS